MEREGRLLDLRQVLVVSTTIVLLSFLSTYLLAIIAAGGLQGVLLGWKFSLYLLFPALLAIVSTFVFKEFVSEENFRKWLPAVPAISLLLLAVAEFAFQANAYAAFTPVASVIVGLGFRPLSSTLEKHRIARVLAYLFIIINVSFAIALSGPQYFDFLAL